MKTKLNYYSLFILCLTLISCGKNDFAPSPFEYYVDWTPHSDIKYDYSNITNAHATENRLYLAGDNYFLTLDKQHQLITKKLYFPDASSNGFNNRTTITDELFGYRVLEPSTHGNLNFPTKPSSKLKVHLNEHPNISTIIDLDILDLDTTKWVIYNREADGFIFTENRQLLVPAIEVESDSNQIVIFVIDVLINENILYSLNRKINIPVTSNYGSLNNGFSQVGDNLYLAAQNSLYRINLTNDEVVEVRDNVFYLDAIKMENDTTYLIITDTGYKTAFYYVLPNGENEGLQTSFHNQNGAWQFSNINGKLLGYWNRSIGIFAADFQENYIWIQEIQNSGLEREVIYKMILFQDRVYTTTPSGVFFKTVSNFFEKK